MIPKGEGEDLTPSPPPSLTVREAREGMDGPLDEVEGREGGRMLSS